MISFSPESWISGCETPSWSTRLRMISTARFERFAVDLRLRRRLALVDQLDAAAQVEAELRRLRDDDDQRGDEQPGDEQQDEEVFRRSVIALASLLGRRQDEQQPALALFVVGGEDVGAGARAGWSRRPATWTGTSSARTPHSSTRSIGSSSLSKSGREPSRCPGPSLRAPRARQRERVASAADHASLAVADEEGRVGRRVVVVEQLEQERETALAAALALAREAEPAVDLGRAVSAVRADEGMCHAEGKSTKPRARGPRGLC